MTRPSLGITAMELFACNPFRVLGIAVDTPTADVTLTYKKLLDMADNWLMLLRVELTVYADNERAIHLYEKYGFVKEGVKRKAAISCGQYKDEILMARIKDFD